MKYQTAHFINATFIVLLLIIAIGCKKEAAQTPGPAGCRIITATTGSSSSITISYLPDGKIAKMESEQVIQTYSYSGNTVTILTKDDGSFDGRKILTLNSDGLPVNVRGDYNEAGTEWYNDAFEYNGKEVSKKVESDYSTSATATINYTWADGNLQKEQSGSYGTTTYQYYTDKTIRDGDYFYYEQLLSDGYQFVLNKHLLKSSVSNSAPADNYTYTFDADEKIISYREDARQPVSYTYQCN